MHLTRWISCVTVLALATCAATSCKHNGSPQPGGIVGRLGDYPIEHVVILAIDGLRRDTLFEYLTTQKRFPGGLHDLLGVLSDGYDLQFTKAIAVRRGVTIFPSYTYPAWTSIFTGVFPGVHGIAGNMFFFRESKEARFYGEKHLDTLRANIFGKIFGNIFRGFFRDFGRDISDKVKTLYEVVETGGGDSHVIHHMIGRGARVHAYPGLGSAWAYLANASETYDRDAIVEAVADLKNYNEGRAAADFRLPTITTVYFAGLDHELHIAGPDAGMRHLAKIDTMIAQLICGVSVLPPC